MCRYFGDSLAWAPNRHADSVYPFVLGGLGKTVVFQINVVDMHVGPRKKGAKGGDDIFLTLFSGNHPFFLTPVNCKAA